MRTIFFLVATTPHAWKPYTDAFEAQLRTHPRLPEYQIQYQPASGVQELYEAIATRFVNNAVSGDVIVTGGTRPTLACANATKIIPIVYATAGLDDLSGNNVTGISNQQVQHVTDRFDYVIETINPNQDFCFSTIGNTDARNVRLEMDEVENQANRRKLNFHKNTMPLQTADEIKPVLENLARSGVKGVFVCTDPLITTNAELLNEWALVYGLSTTHSFEENWGTKGHMWCGPKLKDMFETAADFVARILSGEDVSKIKSEVAKTLDKNVHKAIGRMLGL